MRKKLRKVIYPILFIFTLYIISGLILSHNQKKFIFKPEKLPADYVYKLATPHKEFNLPLNDTNRINALLLEADTARGIIIYFHGNAGNITTHIKQTPLFIRHHYDILMMDYPGFGKSTGPDTEQDLYKDALFMYQLAKKYFVPDSIIIYGQSLGTAMASYVASRRDCKALILESPFYSMDALARHYFPIYSIKKLLDYHFPVYHFIQRTSAPVYIFHGTRDKVIPFSQSKRLASLLGDDDQFIPVPDANHNNLYTQPTYQHVMDSLLNF